MIVPLVIVGGLAVMLLLWPQDAAYILDVIIDLCKEASSQIREGLDEAHESTK